MRALRLTRWGQPAELCEVRAPVPGPGQVVVRVGGSGACHSDLHLMEWPEGRLSWRVPFTLGHENAGWVEEVGAGVTSVHRGDAVVVYGPWGCGTCRTCRLGRENYCERADVIGAAGGGLGLDGGMAELMLVPSARFLVPIGELDPIQVAPLADAGLTPYHAIARSRDRLQPGSTAVVIGIGGLGQMAIQLLDIMTSARVIAVDRDDRKLEHARRLGAEHALRSDAGALGAIKRVTADLGADVVLDMVGAESTLALGARALRTEGRLVILGLAMGTLPIDFFSIPYGAEVATSYWGTVTELMELVALAHAGRIRMEVEPFTLDQAPEVYAWLRRGDVRGRAVIVPSR